MKMINALKILVLLCLLGMSTQSQALNTEETIYADLMTRNNAIHVKVAAQSIFNKNMGNVELTDIAAEVLNQSLNGSINLDVDIQSWLAKAVGASGNLRYNDFLTSVIDSDVPGKLVKFTKQARDNLVKKSTDTFIPGKLKLAEVVDKIAKDKLNAKSSLTREQFNMVYPGDTVNKALDTLGMPDNISVVFANKRQAWLGTVRYSMLSISYQKLGTLNFEYFGDQGNWIVDNVKQAYREVTSSSSAADAASVRNHQMMGNNPNAVRGYIKRIMNQGGGTQLDMDLAAERLYSDLNTRSYVDTLSWACKLLAMSGNSRYRTVLEYTMENSEFRKLRNYAHKSVKQITGGNDKQYTKGDVFKAATAK